MNRLTNLFIKLETYGVNKDRYTGSVEFANEHGTVEINLGPEVAEKILAVVADQLVESSKEIAANLTAEIINQDHALPSPEAAGA